jgi:apolipoprotein N-acyltransferase
MWREGGGEMIFTVFGIAILAIVGFWLFGGVVLRVAGIVFVFAGLFSLVTLANPAALLMVVIGLAMWLAGHWHFALRHHEYKSPLARRIFLQVLPPRYDPTRHWGTQVVSRPPDPERSALPEPSAYPDGSRPRDSLSG